MSESAPEAKARKLVLVEWIDSHSGKGWEPLDEIASGGGRPIYCRSVGWLLSENDETTVLVAHISGERNENFRLFGSGDISIPTRTIVKRSALTEVP